MASQDHGEHPDQNERPAGAGSSVRVAMVIFLGTLVVLAAMAVYWLIIRV